jgi:hypothetical protein
MTEFTPGPWSLTDDSPMRLTADFGSDWIGSIPRSRYVDGRSDEEQLANARLIRATPDLLTAAQSAVDLISGDLTGVEWKVACREFLRRARAAIAKATQ